MIRCGALKQRDPLNLSWVADSLGYRASNTPSLTIFSFWAGGNERSCSLSLGSDLFTRRQILPAHSYFIESLLFLFHMVILSPEDLVHNSSEDIAALRGTTKVVQIRATLAHDREL